MRAERKAVPIPKATTSARSDCGRAMSGRIGMSLASTVSRVIDVPATHSSGVDRIWPAWTEAISSSRDSKSVAAGAGDEGLARLRDAGRLERRQRTRRRARRRRRPTSASRRGRGDARPGRSRRPRWSPPAATMTVGEPIGRHEHERDEQAAEDRAGRVDREQRAGLAAGLGRARRGAARTRSGRRCRARSSPAGRRGSPSGRGPQGLERLARVERLGHDEDADQAEDGQAGDEQLAHGQDPDRVAASAGRRRCR